jgi:UDP-glucose 4-epimerase
VAVVDDLSRGRREWLDPAAELHVSDVRDASALRSVVAAAEPDVVVHLAALHFIPAVDGAPDLARDVNVNATRSLLDALEPAPPELFLFASTAAVYPNRSGPIPEACEPAPLDLYGETKLAGEQLVASYGARTGTRTVVARIFNIVGPRETNPHVVPELVDQVRANPGAVRLGNLSPRRDYTDVRDVADALRRLLDLGEGSPTTFNVGSGRSTSVADLVRECEALLGRTIEVEVDARRLRPVDRAELVADSRRLREATAWEPRRSLRDTLRDLLEA